MNKNNKAIGKFEDELGEKILSEFVGVWSKAYAYKCLTRGLNEFKCEKKLTGLKKNVLKETMNFQHLTPWMYLEEKECLLRDESY